MKKKKIFYVVESFGGGVLSYLENLSNNLCDDYDIYLLYGLREQTPKDLKSLFSSKINLIEIKKFSRIINLKNDYAAYKEIKKHVNRIKPDIVHLHSSKAGGIGRLLKIFNLYRYRNIKFFYTPHGYSFLNEDNSFLSNFIYQFIEMLLGNLNTKTIACGKGEYFYSKKINKSSLFVNNCVDASYLGKFITKSSNSEDVIYTVGRICNQKNPDLFNEIAEKNLNKKFVWIGDGELRYKLTSDNIKITGWLEHEEVLRATQKYNTFLLTSKWEGMPISLLEAEYYGKKCFVTPIHGNSEIIDETNGKTCITASEFSDVIKSKYVSCKYDENNFPFTVNKMINGYKEIYER